MQAHIGDRITVESERAAQPCRSGVIEDVHCDDPLRVTVRWDDGHSSMLAPAAGAATVVKKRKPRARA